MSLLLLCGGVKAWSFTNVANSPQNAAFDTDSPDTSFTAVYPAGTASITSDAGGQVTVDVPALSLIIYRADTPLPPSVAAPGIALGHFFGRLGCFAAGCCFGRPALDFPLGIKFTSQYAHTHTGVPLNTALYPTQLFEAGLNLLNFIILMTVFYRKKFNGQVILLYLFNYSLIRFVIEYFRGDGDRGYIFGGPANPFTSLSVPQLISLIGIIISIVLYRRFKKRGADKTV